MALLKFSQIRSRSIAQVYEKLNLIKVNGIMEKSF